MSTSDKWIQSDCYFSEDRTHRFSLFRQWERSCLPVVNFLMLNPSTADETKNDNTVERCERRARRMGFSSMYITNLFSVVSTDPDGIKQCSAPSCDLNDGQIFLAAMLSGRIICAWGCHGKHRGRQSDVLRMLKRYDLYAIRVNKDGTPAHPLYVGYDVEPVLWHAGARE